MNQPSSTVIELLSIISGIERKHELVAELTGENFNIFRILGLETRENKHSAFLCELLDPKGSHGMKATFLKSFVDKIVSLVAGRFDLPAPAWDDASVKPEKHIGSVSEDYLIGGRLDIEIIPAQEGRRIFIENKIGAGDQQCQLVRYHMHEPAACLLYLTLNGKEASQWSTVHDTAAISLTAGKDYFCVSWANSFNKVFHKWPRFRV